MKGDPRKSRRRGLFSLIALASLVLTGGAIAQVERAEIVIDGLT